MTKAIPLKRWIYEEAARAGVLPHAIVQRRLAGWYPGLSEIKINRRVIFVERDETPPRIRLRSWVTQEAKRVGLTIGAIYQRLHRGKYPQLRLTKIHRGVVFIEGSQ